MGTAVLRRMYSLSVRKMRPDTSGAGRRNIRIPVDLHATPYGLLTQTAPISIMRKKLPIFLLLFLGACGPSETDARNALPQWVTVHVGDVRFNVISFEKTNSADVGSFYEVQFRAEIQFPDGANPECEVSPPKHSVPCYFVPIGGTHIFNGVTMTFRKAEKGWLPN